MRSVFTCCAVLMAAVLATACVEGVDGVDGIDEEQLEEVEGEPPAAQEPEVVTLPQAIQLNDDPDEGGQIKPRSNHAARNTATR